YHKLLAYKDEYEVARLHLETEAKAREAFEGDFKMTFHLAPPFLSGKGAHGRPMKRAFGPWIMQAYRLLAPMKHLRGTPFDPFGYTAERRMERALIRQYEADMSRILAGLTPERMDVAVALAELPLHIRGFGPVKAANERAAAKRRQELWSAFETTARHLKTAAE
ncbi:MAG: DUF6537 domain-containing protein, partial [Pseudomonadota bacterium]